MLFCLSSGARRKGSRELRHFFSPFHIFTVIAFKHALRSRVLVPTGLFRATAVAPSSARLKATWHAQGSGPVRGQQVLTRRVQRERKAPKTDKKRGGRGRWQAWSLLGGRSEVPDTQSVGQLPQKSLLHLWHAEDIATSGKTSSHRLLGNRNRKPGMCGNSCALLFLRKSEELFPRQLSVTRIIG